MSKINKHTVLFVRHSGFDLIAHAVICRFSSYSNNGKIALQGAVTAWIDQTDEGASAYAESCEDFNIGDLGLHSDSNPELLAAFGVYDLSVEVIPIDDIEQFDRHLYQPE